MRAENGRLGALLASHSWLGLFSSWVLALVFLAGAVTMFQRELGLWEKMPAALGRGPVAPGLIDASLARVPFPAAVRDRQVELLLPVGKSGFLHIYSYDADGDYAAEHAVHPASGAFLASPERSSFGEFIEEFHKTLLLPMGNYLVGFASFAMVVGLVSGLILYWPKLSLRAILRPRIDQPRLRWRNLHVSLGVLGLPFYAVLAMTGAIFSFSHLIEIGAVYGRLGGDAQPITEFAYTAPPVPAMQHRPMAVSGIDARLARAVSEFGIAPTRLSVLHYGDRSATLVVHGHMPGSFAEETRLIYPIAQPADRPPQIQHDGNALKIGEAMLRRLHYGDFAGFPLRLVYFVLAIATCLLVSTGNLYWIEKRLAQRTPARSLRLVIGLSVGSCAGGMLALSAALLATRVLPLARATRGSEIETLFLAVLLLTAIAGLIFARRPRRTLAVLSCLAALLFLLVPAADWLRHGAAIARAAGEGDFAAPAIHLLCVTLACGNLAAAAWLRREGRERTA